VIAQAVAHDAPASGRQLTTPRGTPACSKISTAYARQRRLRRRLHDDRVARDQRRRAGAPSSAYGKFQGAITAHTPYGRSTLVFVSVGPAPHLAHVAALSRISARSSVEIGRLFDLAQRLDAVLPISKISQVASSSRRSRTMSAARSRIAARSCQGTALQRGKAACAAATASFTSVVVAVATRPTTRRASVGLRLSIGVAPARVSPATCSG
jgi:hypothetical protein